MRLISELSAWMVAVLHHWQVLVTGGILTAILTGIQLWRERSFSWQFSRWVFLFFLVVAFFFAWRDKYREVLQLKAILSPATRAIAQDCLKSADRLTRVALKYVLDRGKTDETQLTHYLRAEGLIPPGNLFAAVSTEIHFLIRNDIGMWTVDPDFRQFLKDRL